MNSSLSIVISTMDYCKEILEIYVNLGSFRESVPSFVKSMLLIIYALGETIIVRVRGVGVAFQIF